MKQQTLAMAADKGFEQYRRRTKRDVFLNTMNKVMPWRELCAVVEPHYPKGEGGRPPVGLERMLRMLFVQHWFNLADEAWEEALYDSESLRSFVGIDLGRERAPDAKTLLKFRRLRARVEHVFAVVKRLWGFSKVRYRGLHKNATRAFTALALANIYMSRGLLLARVRL